MVVRDITELEIQVEFASGGRTETISRWMKDGLVGLPVFITKCIMGCIPQRLLSLVDSGMPNSSFDYVEPEELKIIR